MQCENVYALKLDVTYSGMPYDLFGQGSHNGLSSEEGLHYIPKLPDHVCGDRTS